MKLFATMSILVVAALAALVPVAPAALPSGSQGLTPRERYELNQRYQQTRGLAPSPEALAARVQQRDLVERYVNAHPSATSDLVERYIMTRGLAPSPEALAARASSDDGFDWGGVSISSGLLLAALLLAVGATFATRHVRDRYASV